MLTRKIQIKKFLRQHDVTISMFLCTTYYRKCAIIDEIIRQSNTVALRQFISPNQGHSGSSSRRGNKSCLHLVTVSMDQIMVTTHRFLQVI